MKRIVGPGRRPDDWTSAHERAMVRLSERLDAPLAPAEETWLAEHLAGCEACGAAAIAYEEQRRELRALAMPEPPRDLWARTMGAIEAEERRRGRAGRPAAARVRMFPLGALAGAMVVAVVLGATFLVAPPGPDGRPTPPASGVASGSPAATPLVVDAQVAWLVPTGEGGYTLNVSSVDEVCAVSRVPDCAPLAGGPGTAIAITGPPRAVVQSPAGGELVIVDAATKTTGGTVFVLPIPTPAASPGPSPSEPSSPEPTTTPSAGPTILSTAEPSVGPTPQPSPTTAPSIGPTPSAVPSDSLEPSVAPSPAPGGAVAIIENVVVVGEVASYSPSGAWFAFSARPADGSHGPDIYVWQPGEAVARPVTTDHRSIFSAWVGERLLGSRAVEPGLRAPTDPSAIPSPMPPASPSPSPSPSDADASPTPAPAVPVAFLLDPATGIETVVPGPGIWRPVVDPTGRWVVYWEGSIVADPTGLTWLPGEGRLVLAAWDASAVAPSPEPSGETSPSESPASSPAASPSLEGQPSAPASPIVSPPITLAEGPIVDWDIGWDETATRLALWLADPADPNVGRLSLLAVDPVTGFLADDGALLVDEPALPGFSVGEGRLAWATPPGQGGEGSRLEVLAWVGEDVGKVVSQPGSGDVPVVVVR